jgi:O-antigen/teichoic acid export membrane protein
MKRLKSLARGIVQLASGEIPGRLCGIATLLILARQSGVIMVGVYALAQSMVQYSYPFIDFGLRHVGARLVAKYPAATQEIVARIQKRRVLMGASIVPFLFLYATLTNVTLEFKIFIFLFSAIGCLYAVSLEWVAWGMEHLRLVGLTRLVVPGSVLLFLLLGRTSRNLLWYLVAGNAVGYGLQAFMFLLWWRHRRSHCANESLSVEVVQNELAWSKTSIMGLAWLCNLAFNTIDMLMLGVMSNAQQVGLYSAAYRVTNQVLFTYYLLTQVLYPQLARQTLGDRRRSIRPGILFLLFGAGFGTALVLWASRRFVLSVVFGAQFLAATSLLMLLAWAIPLDFLTSYLSNAYIAWGMEKKVLLCTAVAAGSNILLNLVWIPRYGARAAAVNTLISYVIFLGCLVIAGRYGKELSVPLDPETQLLRAARS